MIVHEKDRTQNGVENVEGMDVLLDDPFALEMFLPHAIMRGTNGGKNKMLHARKLGGISNIFALLKLAFGIHTLANCLLCLKCSDNVQFMTNDPQPHPSTGESYLRHLEEINRNCQPGIILQTPPGSASKGLYCQRRLPIRCYSCQVCPAQPYPRLFVHFPHP